MIRCPPKPTPLSLHDALPILLSRVEDDVSEPDRRTWLAGQIGALRTQAAALAGERLPYLDFVSRCFGWTPVRRDEAVFQQAATEISRLLPARRHATVDTHHRDIAAE